jgi:diguanylate cyclase (GGDEF)-like protein
MKNMDKDLRIHEAIRGNLPGILDAWRKSREGVVEREQFLRLEAGVERLIEVFADFLISPESVDTFSRGGEIHDLVGEIAKQQHELGRDAVGVIEDFAVLRRCTWRTVEDSLDLSELSGGEVARFFVKLMQASDWITETALEAYDDVLSKEMEEALGRAAATDLITGLPDRDLFNRLLLPRAINAYEQLALAIFDVVDFSETVASGKIKRARKVLRGLAGAIQKNVPEDAVCARFGDDEICVVIPDVSGEAAYKAAERVLALLADERHGFEVDVGVAEYPAHAGDDVGLIAAAQTALRMAKRVGGSGIVVAR